MSDFPAMKASALPLHVIAGAYGRQAELAAAANFSSGGPGQNSTWVAKLVEYMPVALPWDYPVQRVWWINGSTITTTNVDFGIYTPDGKRIFNTGSTAMVGVSSVQYVTPATPFILPRGAYYFAWSCDNTTARAVTHVGTAPISAIHGLLEETTGSFGLPASMTPVSFARAWGYNICGVTRTTTGF